MLLQAIQDANQASEPKKAEKARSSTAQKGRPCFWKGRPGQQR